MVAQEIRDAEEEMTRAKAVGQSKQEAWTRWENVEQPNVRWSVIWQMEPLRISFLFRSTYDLLPTPANLSTWYEEQSDCCIACGNKGTLQHILSACPSALSGGMYTWRHNMVLRIIAENVEQRVEHVNAESVPASTRHFISFVREGFKSSSQSSIARSKILSSTNDWQLRADLDGGGCFPEEVAITSLRPDIVIWSVSEQGGSRTARLACFRDSVLESQLV